MDQQRDIALTVLSAFIAMCVLALAVAFLRAKRLAYTIQAFVVLQVRSERSLRFGRGTLSCESCSPSHLLMCVVLLAW